MGKEKMITRTLTVSKVLYTTVALSTSTVSTALCEIVGRYTVDTALAAVKKQAETDDIKVVCVNDVTHREALYGMSESDFYRNSKELPARSSTD